MDNKKGLLKKIMERLGRRWQVRYKYNKKHLIFDLLIAGAAIVTIGMLLFWIFGGLHYLTDKTTIEISLQNEEVVLGGENAFVIDYRNDNDFDLEEFGMALRFPQGFVAQDVSNKNYDSVHNILTIGRLKAGAAGSLILKGEIWGNIREKQRVVVNASYYKTDSRGQKLWGLFQAPHYLEYEISKSDFGIGMNLPDKVVNGQIVHMEVKIKNGFGYTLNKIIVQPSANNNFQIVSGGQGYFDGAWNIQDLKKNEERTISAGAILSGAAKVNPTVVVLYEVNGKKMEIARVSQAISLFTSGFVADAHVKESIAQPGGKVDFVINYDNQGSFSLKNATFKLELLSDYWDLRGTALSLGSIKNNVISISAKDVSKLALIQPGEKGEIALNVGVKKYLANVLSNLHARLVVLYEIDNLPVEIWRDKINIPLSSDLGLSASARYFTEFGEQLGRGPLPPKVGSETKYWIFVRALNNINDVDEVSVVAELASNVGWLDKFNVMVGDALVYNETTKEVSWKISKIPAGAENFGFAFEAGLTPSASQKGQYATLVKNIKIVGKDAVTGQNLEFTVGPITTNLTADKLGQLKGGRVK